MRVLWIGCLLCLLLIGCDKTILDDLEVYGKAAPVANRQLKQVSEAFGKVRHISELKRLRQHLREQVLPLLLHYVKSLKRIKLKHKEMKEAHGLFVAANRSWYEALRHFERNATNNKKRIQLLQPLEKKARTYERALKKYKRYMAVIYQDVKKLQ